MSNVALYIRVSSSEQVKGYSLEAQEDLLRRYATDHNMTVYKLYADQGKSANKALSKRTALLEMVADAEAKRFDTILFKDITRWSRNSYHYWIIQDRLDKCGCSWIAVEQPYLQTKDPTGRFQVSIMLSTAQLESENNSQRVRFVKYNMVQNKIVPYSDRMAPLGYKVQKIDGVRRLVIDSSKREMMDDLFAHLLTHRNAAWTRRYIQEQYGVSLTSTYFSRIQKNPVYCGTYQDVSDFCEPYITQQQHDALCEWSNAFRRSEHTDQYIFRKLIRCKRCGRAMQPTLIRGHVYYRCPSRYLENKCDMGRTVRQDRIEQFLLNSIRPAFNDYKYRVEIEQNEHNADNNSERIERLRAKLKRLNDLYIDGAIDKDEYDRRKASYNAEIDRLEPHRTIDMSEVETLLNQPWETLYNELDSADAKAAFWRSMIKSVYFDGMDLSIDFI